MAYEYYCTNCGKKLDKTTVLFDMRRLLIESESSDFTFLKFRLKETELKALIASGVPEENGYRRCSLTLPQVMQYISNRNNLANNLIAGLTLEQIKEYTESQVAAPVQKTKSHQYDYGNWGNDDENDIDDETDLGVPEPEKKEKPIAIQVLESKVEALLSDVAAEALVKDELGKLRAVFEQEQGLSFLIQEYKEEDDTGEELIVGYRLVYGISGVSTIESCRVCPKCGTPVFEHAGTAKHRSVVFIGNPASGKTSTILALTHYANNHMTNPDITPIWRGAQHIETVKNVEPIGSGDKLRYDLELYKRGIAPERTDADERKKAYTSTFWLTGENGRKFILTLTDLPGEICNIDGRGTVNQNAVLNEFQVALSCDAFIACFDTSTVVAASKSLDAEGRPISTGFDSPGEIINRICRQIDLFQSLRATESNQKTYIPTMLLFTKCYELELGIATPVEANGVSQRPVERTYMFRKEKDIIDGNGIYAAVCKAFNNSGRLAKAYHAMLRCSPYGFAAPSETDVKNDTGLEENLVSPTPKNIDLLMNWLLAVSGCIPVKGRYCPNLRDDGTGLTLDHYYLAESRIPQYRSQPPLADDEEREALARCTLFENPGTIDRSILQSYGQSWAVKLTERWRRRNQSNDMDGGRHGAI